MAQSTLADLQLLDPEDFERLVGSIFTKLGYIVTVTKRSGDEGVDLELHRGEERSIAQCKRYRGTVGQPAIRDFYGTLIHENATRGYFVTTGQFSLAATTWVLDKHIALTDGVDLLAALENAGLSPTPRQAETPHHRMDATSLAELVNAGLREPALHGRILLDGAPPDRHDYDELASYLASRFQNDTDIAKGPRLKDQDWSTSDARIRIIDEFDSLSRASMEDVLDVQRQGARSPGLRPREYVNRDEHRRQWDEFNATRHSFVLVATVWEKKLPKAVRSRFSTVVPAHDLDWSSFRVSGDP